MTTVPQPTESGQPTSSAKIRVVGYAEDPSSGHLEVSFDATMPTTSTELASLLASVSAPETTNWSHFWLKVGAHCLREAERGSGYSDSLVQELKAHREETAGSRLPRYGIDTEETS